MKYYAVIDTNVLVSALLKRNSVPNSVLTLSMDGVIIPLLHPDIVNEYRTVLMRPKFKFSEKVVDAIISSLEKMGVYIDALEVDEEIPDPKDRIFYEVVMEERQKEDAYLVTGNLKHFPTKHYVVTPREMLDIISLENE